MSLFPTKKIYPYIKPHIFDSYEEMAKFIIEEETIEVKPGDTIIIEPNKVFTYEGNMIITFEMTPNFKEENDHFVKKVDYDVHLKR